MVNGDAGWRMKVSVNYYAVRKLFRTPDDYKKDCSVENLPEIID